MGISLGLSGYGRCWVAADYGVVRQVLRQLVMRRQVWRVMGRGSALSAVKGSGLVELAEEHLG